jgi:dihydroxy-acid dehydratase
LPPLQPGDIIEIDLEARSIQMKLSEEEINQRLAALPPFQPRTHSKWLRRYAHFVTSADQGAVLNY